MTVDGVIWQDPPERKRGRRHPVWIKRLEPLIERPGHWAIIHTYDNPKTAFETAGNLRRGVVHLPPGKWEFTGRKNSEKHGDLYARYLGDSEQ